jgi:hydrogenase expression/formation protein HypC
MCVTQVGRVVSLEETTGLAVVDVNGFAHRISLAPLVLDGQPVGAGEWVLIHAGLAVERLDEADATELAAFTRSLLEDRP